MLLARRHPVRVQQQHPAGRGRRRVGVRPAGQRARRRKVGRYSVAAVETVFK